jgi:nucleoside-diphosphate-sugar epimerase
MRVLVVGCGYVGTALAIRLQGLGHEVWALRRSQVPVVSASTSGINFHQADITRPETLSSLPSLYDWVVNCVSASRGGAEDYRAVYVEGMRNLLEWLRVTAPQKFVYTSSTGVYGQIDGSAVDEESPTVPEAETARILIEAEQVLLGASRRDGFPGVVLRVAGIYGPGRGFWFKQFLNGEARIEADGERVLNSIHLEDVVGSIVAALEKGKPGRIYNAVDDHPSTQLEVFQWLSQRLNKPLPPRAEPGAEMASKRGMTNKRVSNRRLKTELGYSFRYPTFKEGYAAEVERVVQPPSSAL